MRSRLHVLEETSLRLSTTIMLSYRLFCKSLLKTLKNYSTKSKPKVEVNKQVLNDIENGLFKPRKHPGIFKPKAIQLPPEFLNAAEKALADFPVKQILNDSKKLANYIKNRLPPIEKVDLRQKKFEIEDRIYSNLKDKEISEEEINELNGKIKWAVQTQLKSQIYNWKPVQYNVHTALQYLLGRSAAEYAVLVRIFQEIASRDLDFKPRSFFDFGSGVGTGIWAARLFWQKYIFEYFNVDVSADMNDLALILLKGGTGVKEPNIKGLFFRQFLPATNVSYDLVISAYSLLELPSSRTRLETILNLWNKTQNYLVIVEQGTNAGFKVICEARDFILDMKTESNQGFVFSPCPHDLPCPRFLADTAPCGFELSYMSIPIGQNSETYKEKYCYIVLKKGIHNEDVERWPRIVKPTLVRSKHTICRLCTASGKLEEVIFSAAKHGKVTYHCARASKWGDLLPVKISTPEE